MGVARDWRTRMKERQRFWSVSHGFKARLYCSAPGASVTVLESCRVLHTQKGIVNR